MSIKALIKITDRDKKGKLIEHKIGDTINLSADEEKRLIEIGFAEAGEDSNATNTQNNNNTQDNTATNTTTADGPDTAYPGA